MSRQHLNAQSVFCRWKEKARKDGIICAMWKQTDSGIVKIKKTTETVVDSAFYGKVREVFEQARQFVRTTANFAMVKAYWLVGKMIVEKQGGAAKAAYGDGLIDELSRRLTNEFGAGFKRVNLFNMRRFFLSFPKVHTLCEQLSWSHYRLLISVENEEARRYYLTRHHRGCPMPHDDGPPPKSRKSGKRG